MSAISVTCSCGWVRYDWIHTSTYTTTTNTKNCHACGGFITYNASSDMLGCTRCGAHSNWDHLRHDCPACNKVTRIEKAVVRSTTKQLKGSRYNAIHIVI
eukprot:TRINITY_DN2838_c0_g1_i1.p1 TRINITY_DN2838_c0_g1~~TRINITY_DN2838_c0_g1_i1.p1  ORF type:complete len:100 (+),score=6.10 TRINITY_DN2838_c0_g1_i1:30-329(+)